jgi:ribosomal protein L33
MAKLECIKCKEYIYIPRAERNKDEEIEYKSFCSTHQDLPCYVCWKYLTIEETDKILDEEILEY